MATWSRDKVDSTTLNSGNEYDSNSQFALDEMNAIVNGGLYSQDFAEALTDTPDTSEADNVSSAQNPMEITLIDNIKNGKTYKKFKFKNIKGQTGTNATVVTSWSATQSEEKVPSEKLVYTSIKGTPTTPNGYTFATLDLFLAWVKDTADIGSYTIQFNIDGNVYSGLIQKAGSSYASVIKFNYYSNVEQNMCQDGVWQGWTKYALKDYLLANKGILLDEYTNYFDICTELSQSIYQRGYGEIGTSNVSNLKALLPPQPSTFGAYTLVTCTLDIMGVNSDRWILRFTANDLSSNPLPLYYCDVHYDGTNIVVSGWYNPNPVEEVLSTTSVLGGGSVTLSEAITNFKKIKIYNSGKVICEFIPAELNGSLQIPNIFMGTSYISSTSWYLSNGLITISSDYLTLSASIFNYFSSGSSGADKTNRLFNKITGIR